MMSKQLSKEEILQALESLDTLSKKEYGQSLIEILQQPQRFKCSCDSNSQVASDRYRRSRLEGGRHYRVGVRDLFI